jgi:hypothetical protein
MSTRGPLSHRGVYAPRGAAEKGFGDSQGQLKAIIRKENMKTQYATWNELARFAGEYAQELKPQYAVYDSQGKFMARFLSHKRALAWVIANDMEWIAIIRKESRK